MLYALLLSSSFAHATEVAIDKKFGLGVATGVPYLNVTMKYYLNDKSGIAAYAGSSILYHDLRAAWQSEFVEAANWSWARLPIYWQAGIDVGLWTASYGYASGRLGVFGGAGGALQFHNVPAEVFVEASIGVFPVNGYCTDSNVVADAVCWVQPGTTVGGRWYF